MAALTRFGRLALCQFISTSKMAPTKLPAAFALRAPARINRPASTRCFASATGNYECLCKKCGFEVKGEPALAVLCHCESCRVYGSDAARVAAYSPEQFKITKGQDGLIKYESAPGKFRCTCSTCGSFVHNILPNGLMVAPLGGTKWGGDGDPVEPRMHIFMSDCGLETVNDDLPQHAEFP
eukprot:CAMPEP_0172613860 /NCGR_PEP_ID=MMETSP1068-20121228/48017_1 /TAXON_ID=35684 /ORGANISM="Pseudopedinella elastica, Strain CCMP716" /LENGTH=180 /DNA_ID=CAMNT_0013418469 /DNA_START=24 /DNA_END=566 /DNA_ORIENTATION=+